MWDHVARIEGDVDVTEPWMALGAMALATTRVALGPLVTPLARRRPWNVARAAVTLDHMSGGRAVLGVGLAGGVVIAQTPTATTGTSTATAQITALR